MSILVLSFFYFLLILLLLEIKESISSTTNAEHHSKKENDNDKDVLSILKLVVADNRNILEYLVDFVWSNIRSLLVTLLLIRFGVYVLVVQRQRRSKSTTTTSTAAVDVIRPTTDFEKLLSKNLKKKKRSTNDRNGDRSSSSSFEGTNSSSSSIVFQTFYSICSSSKMTSLMGSSFPGSPNADVLEVDIPKTLEEKKGLLEELKRRGRAAVQSTNYKEAEHLYSKAIDVSNALDESDDLVKKERAILYSNRSLARYQMGLLEGSHTDAREATKLDSTYVKGFWRWGQACMAQQLYEEALEAYKAGKSLDPSNKAITKEYEKALKKVEEEKKLLNEAMNMSLDDDGNKNNGGEKKVPPKKATTSSKSTSTVKPPASKKPKTPPSSSTADDSDDEDVEFTKSEVARGYKIVGGKKTSYFHNELTEEAKQLIGDIAPKKLDEAPAEFKAPPAVVEGASAWNKAGTWEEKDVTQWAKSSLEKYIKQATYTIPHMGTSGSDKFTDKIVVVTKVPTCEGHASVATVRGKKRYIYEFSIKIEWQLVLSKDETCKGSVTFPDVDGTCDGVYDMTDYTVHKDTPTEAKHVLERFVKHGGLRDSITNQMNEWVQHFQTTY